VYKSCLLFLLLFPALVFCQSLNFRGGAMLKAEVTLGNQNQWLKIGAFGFGALNYGDASLESGISIAGYQFYKRHTKKIRGLGYSYEFFTMAGIGKNTNLLGSGVSHLNTQVLFNPNGKGGFNGLGFGFRKDALPGDLKSYGIKQGQFIMRFSNADHSVHMMFLNDFKFGEIFNGERTDYATTGALHLGFANIDSRQSVYQVGIGLELFTPQADYTRSARNSRNSDDGRKHVWFMLPPHKDLFYANLFAFGSYQSEYYNLSGSVGMNSQKLGAFVQNTLHDGFGLNPRFPWDVSAKDRIYIEGGAQTFYSIVSDD